MFIRLVDWAFFFWKLQIYAAIILNILIMVLSNIQHKPLPDNFDIGVWQSVMFYAVYYVCREIWKEWVKCQSQ